MYSWHTAVHLLWCIPDVTICNLCCQYCKLPLAQVSGYQSTPSNNLCMGISVLQQGDQDSAPLGSVAMLMLSLSFGIVGGTYRGVVVSWGYCSKSHLVKPSLKHGRELRLRSQVDTGSCTTAERRASLHLIHDECVQQVQNDNSQ